MRNFILGFLLATAALTGGYLAYNHWGGKRSAVRNAPKVSYHCPMHPTYVSDKPGDCPICGMKLVPIESSPSPDQERGHAGHQPDNRADAPESAPSQVPGYASVTIPAERIQSMGITLAKATRESFNQSVRTFGRVVFDETRVHHVHVRFDGYIEDLYVNYTGQYVRKGQPLFSIYSPELYATQNEYLLALRAREQRADTGDDSAIDLVASARERLALWNIGEREIRELERTRKPSRALVIASPVSGYVTGKTAVHGLQVTPADNLYDIVDLSTVWVQADIYEINLPFVQVGQPASIELDYRPGKVWRGRVAFIEPIVDPATRTVKARLEFANPDGQLKPEMYATVTIGGARGTGIAVPESAVIATGERTIVFVAKGEGRFDPREIVVGVRVRNLYEIKRGLAEGEEVATGANFLLDSESKLKASLSGAGEHKHGS